MRDFFRASGKRTRPPRLSVAFKASLLYTLLFGVVVAAAVSVLTWQLSSGAEHYRKLERVSSFAADRLSHNDINFDFASLAESDHVYLEITDPKTGWFRSYGTVPSGVRQGEDSVRRVELRGAGSVVLRVVDLDVSDVRGMLTLPAFLACLAALLISAAVFGALMMRRMMQPVRVMTLAAQKISASDLGRRIEPSRANDELRKLAETFNGMLDRIQNAYEEQKRFVSDASHELRTPLSVISGYANLLRRWGGNDAAVREEAVEKILEETENMQSLVERLLFLARADRQAQTIHPESFSASELMEEIAAETRTTDTSHTVQTQTRPEVSAAADRALLKEAVRAVVENSTKYTPPGGTISLACREENGAVLLSVEDTGIGIAPEDLPHIFERFYKADASRTRTGKSSSGLGLPIAKWIVERHGGSISVQSEPGRGTRTVISIPAVPALPFPGNDSQEPPDRE